MNALLYRLLLLAYPARFRRKYGAAMVADFLDCQRDYATRGGFRSLSAWRVVGKDLFMSAPREHVAAWRRIANRWRRSAGSEGPTPPPGRGAPRRNFFDDRRRDLSFAWRSLRRQPGFSLVAILTLALGIGATTAVYSVADAVVLRPLPYPEPDRLVRLFETDLAQGDDQDTFSGAVFLDWRTRSTSFEELAAYRVLEWTLTGADAPRQIATVSVTPDYFAVFGVDARLGRVFSPTQDAPGSDPVAVISSAMWQREYAGDPRVLGEKLVLNGEPYSIVGVMPASFGYPARRDAAVEVWTAARFRVPDPPVYVGPDPAENRSAGYLSAVARLADGISLAEAQAEMSLVAERIALEHPEESAGEGINIMPLRTSIVGDARPLLLALLAGVGLVMLIACSNVANLFLAKAMQRRPEIAMRLALGASRGRIFGQLLTESVVLAVAAGFVGVGLASFGVDALLAIAPVGLPGAETAALDLRVLSFSLATVLGAGVLFGLAPTFTVVRPDLAPSVRQETGAFAAPGSPGRLGRALIVAEVSMSLMLVVAAGLMGRTFVSLASVEPGFDASDTLVAHVTLPDTRYAEDHQIVAMFDRVVETLRRTPGIESAGSVLTLPMHWNLRGTLRVNIEGKWDEEREDTLAGYQLVTPGYFRTLRIPLVRGRLLEDTDTAGAPFVALINEAFAAEHFRDEDPLGNRITWSDPESETAEWATIVGIVRDVRLEGLDAAAVPETYLSYAQSAMSQTTFVVRGTLSRAELATAMQTAVLEADPEQPITGVATMEEVLYDSLGDRRFNTQLFGSFAVAALLMAAIGLYGVLSFSVAQRTREIGIRRALGAQRSGVVLLVVREGLRLVAIGMILGLIAAAALGRFVAGQLYAVEPADPLTFALAVATILTVGLVATYVPARRAARTDPMVALRRTS